ncbi:MAG: PEP-CTERM sorting domain-containing protein [Burkholderiaceae bacterium]|nr:PEP-CTERM sorting domain-containing protein [Burkholderiaceae bacterium]
MKKLAVAVAAVAAVGAASATTTALGPVSVGVPVPFSGYSNGPFLDIFTFTLPANGGSGYSVTDFTLLPAMFNTALTSFALVSNADGIIGNADDSVVASAFAAGADTLSLTYGASAGGNYYLSVSGITSGSQGGIYNGAISVAAVPEPETYAMMLAGLGALGFLASRRRKG